MCVYWDVALFALVQSGNSYCKTFRKNNWGQINVKRLSFRIDRKQKQNRKKTTNKSKIQEKTTEIKKLWKQYAKVWKSETKPFNKSD